MLQFQKGKIRPPKVFVILFHVVLNVCNLDEILLRLTIAKMAKDNLKRRSQRYHAPGLRGRATGAIAKKNVERDEENLEKVDDFFDSDAES